MTYIETERLLLKPLDNRDVDALFQLYHDFELMQYITGRARTYEETRARLKAHMLDHKQYGFGLYATILKDTGDMIGRCGIEPVAKPTGLEGDIAWMFKQAYWGQGLATEFGQTMIPHGFANFPIQRIFATADHNNTASIKVMKKLGMTFVKADSRGVEYEILNR